ncbi:unnamed protein product [Amoebophrya sp. A25]|nr:unnamed protein product [Amoebophrya sp. A25]|eukprot:GSA25T00016536001.1
MPCVFDQVAGRSSRAEGGHSLSSLVRIKKKTRERRHVVECRMLLLRYPRVSQSCARRAPRKKLRRATRATRETRPVTGQKIPASIIIISAGWNNSFATTTCCMS